MKARIDKYFTDNYDELLELAETSIKVNNRNYEPADLVAYAYERSLRVQSCQDIKAVVYSLILKDCYWTNSSINREMMLKQTPFQGTSDIEPQPSETDEDDLDSKIALEKWYTNKKSLIELYRRKLEQQTNTKAKIQVLDKMIEFNTRNSRYLGKYFGVHYLSAYKYIKEIQDELRAFEAELNNYDNKNDINR